MEITDFGAFASEFFSLTIDPFSRSALVVDLFVEGTFSIQGHAHSPAKFPIDVTDCALAFGELFVITAVAGLFREEQGALEALGMVTVSMVELLGGVHLQS